MFDRPLTVITGRVREAASHYIVVEPGTRIEVPDTLASPVAVGARVTVRATRRGRSLIAESISIDRRDPDSGPNPLTGQIAQMSGRFLWLSSGARVVMRPGIATSELRPGMRVRVYTARRHGEDVAERIEVHREGPPDQ